MKKLSKSNKTKKFAAGGAPAAIPYRANTGVTRSYADDLARSAMRGMQDLQDAKAQQEQQQLNTIATGLQKVGKYQGGGKVCPAGYVRDFNTGRCIPVDPNQVTSSDMLMNNPSANTGIQGIPGGLPGLMYGNEGKTGTFGGYTDKPLQERLAQNAGNIDTSTAATGSVNPALYGVAGTAVDYGLNKITDDENEATVTKQEKFGNVAGSIASGAGQGAAMGAMFGPYGAAVGAGAGAVFGAVKGVKKNKEEERTAQDIRNKEKELGVALRESYMNQSMPVQTGFGYKSSTNMNMQPTNYFSAKTGGVRKVEGGVIKQIPGTDAVKFIGRSHAQGGIKVDPKTEVEGGETQDQVYMKNNAKQDYIYSKYLKLGGKSFAKRHEEILKSNMSAVQKQNAMQDLAKMQEQKAGRDPQQIAKTGGVRRYLNGGPEDCGPDEAWSEAEQRCIPSSEIKNRIHMPATEEDIRVANTTDLPATLHPEDMPARSYTYPFAAGEMGMPYSGEQYTEWHTNPKFTEVRYRSQNKPKSPVTGDLNEGSTEVGPADKYRIFQNAEGEYILRDADNNEIKRSNDLNTIYQSKARLVNPQTYEGVANNTITEPTKVETLADLNTPVSGNTKNKGYLSPEGYAAINEFENTLGTYDANTGKPMGMGRGNDYAQTADKDKIEAFINNTIGKDTWDKLPENVKTQAYGFMFNNGVTKPTIDAAGNITGEETNYNALKGLAQAIDNATGGGDLGDERRAYTPEQAINKIKGADLSNPDLYNNYVNVLGDQYGSIATNTGKFKTGPGAVYAPTLKNRAKSIDKIMGSIPTVADLNTPLTPQGSADAQSNTDAQNVTMRDQNKANSNAPSDQDVVTEGSNTNDSGLNFSQNSDERPRREGEPAFFFGAKRNSGVLKGHGALANSAMGAKMSEEELSNRVANSYETAAWRKEDNNYSDNPSDANALPSSNAIKDRDKIAETKWGEYFGYKKGMSAEEAKTAHENYATQANDLFTNNPDYVLGYFQYMIDEAGDKWVQDINSEFYGMPTYKTGLEAERIKNHLKSKGYIGADGKILSSALPYLQKQATNESVGPIHNAMAYLTSIKQNDVVDIQQPDKPKVQEEPVIEEKKTYTPPTACPPNTFRNPTTGACEPLPGFKAQTRYEGIVPQLAQLVPVGYSMLNPYKITPGVGPIGVASRTILPRVNYNQDKAFLIDQNVALRNAVTSQNAGPGALSAMMAAGTQAAKNQLAISQSESEANKQLAAEEARLNLQAAMTNQEMGLKRDMFNREFFDKQRNYKREEILGALDAAAERTAGIYKDNKLFAAQERLAKALDETGSYDRFTIYEELKKQSKEKDSPYYGKTDVELRAMAASYATSIYGDLDYYRYVADKEGKGSGEGNKEGDKAKLGGVRKYTSRLGELSGGRKRFNI